MLLSFHIHGLTIQFSFSLFLNFLHFFLLISQSFIINLLSFFFFLILFLLNFDLFLSFFFIQNLLPKPIQKLNIISTHSLLPRLLIKLPLPTPFKFLFQILQSLLTILLISKIKLLLILSLRKLFKPVFLKLNFVIFNLIFLLIIRIQIMNFNRFRFSLNEAIPLSFSFFFYLAYRLLFSEIILRNLRFMAAMFQLFMCFRIQSFFHFLFEFCFLFQHTRAFLFKYFFPFKFHFFLSFFFIFFAF